MMSISTATWVYLSGNLKTINYRTTFLCKEYSNSIYQVNSTLTLAHKRIPDHYLSFSYDHFQLKPFPLELQYILLSATGGFQVEILMKKFSIYSAVDCDLSFAVSDWSK